MLSTADTGDRRRENKKNKKNKSNDQLFTMEEEDDNMHIDKENQDQQHYEEDFSTISLRRMLANVEGPMARIAYPSGDAMNHPPKKPSPSSSNLQAKKLRSVLRETDRNAPHGSKLARTEHHNHKSKMYTNTSTAVSSSSNHSTKLSSSSKPSSVSTKANSTRHKLSTVAELSPGTQERLAAQQAYFDELDQMSLDDLVIRRIVHEIGHE